MTKIEINNHTIKVDGAVTPVSAPGEQPHYCAEIHDMWMVRGKRERRLSQGVFESIYEQVIEELRRVA